MLVRRNDSTRDKFLSCAARNLLKDQARIQANPVLPALDAAAEATRSSGLSGVRLRAGEAQTPVSIGLDRQPGLVSPQPLIPADTARHGLFIVPCSAGRLLSARAAVA